MQSFLVLWNNFLTFVFMLNNKSFKFPKSTDFLGELAYVYGTRLRRNKPLKKSTKPLRRTAIKSKQKPIKKISPKRAAELRVYNAEVALFLLKNPLCMAKLRGCQIRSTQNHHKRGRQGEWLLIKLYWLPICDMCHNKITEHSASAIESGLSIRRNST